MCERILREELSRKHRPQGSSWSLGGFLSTLVKLICTIFFLKLQYTHLPYGREASEPKEIVSGKLTINDGQGIRTDFN